MRLRRILSAFPYPRRTSLRDLVAALTLRELLPLGLAIFTLFAVLGPITDLLDGARMSLAHLLATSLFSGCIALLYAFASLRRRWWVFGVVIAVQIGWGPVSTAMFGPVPSDPAVVQAERLKFDGVLTMVLMAASYSCFLWFINGTAARYLRVRAEIELAREIHAVLVPQVSMSVGEFEFAGFSVPSGEVGGDLVDVVVPGGAPPDRWFGYVADVSGHGVSSGVVMGMFKSALRMRLLQGGPVSALLADVNTVLFPLKSGAMYVTAACVRGSGDGTLEYAVAGHLPVLRIRAADRRVEEITTPQIPIGMFEHYDFQSATLPCDPGDLLALITDGLTEVFDTKDREFGMDAVKRVLSESAALPLGAIADRVVAAARAHGVQSDDQTLLLIRRRG